MKIIGMDEAGRGPILGSMFMAAVVCEQKDYRKLKRWGVKDSKLLSEKVREELFEKIVATFEHKIIRVSPEEIDNALKSDSSLNLNWLEAEAHIDLINSFDCGKAIVDCPSKNVESYTDYLLKKISPDIDLVCEHKADLNHVVVGAASILAKVSRDREMKKMSEDLGVACGSGYLSDPTTQAFMKEYWKVHAQVFRTQWAPYKELVKQASQSTLGSFSK